MAEADTQSAEADTEEERVEYPWVSETPTTRIIGTPKGLIYSGRLDDSRKQNSNSYGVILEDPEVVTGSLWQNQEKPEDGTTADGVDEDESRPTDYRVVDEDDRDTTIANGALVTGEEGPNTYDEAEEFEEDAVIVWYNGMSGERLARTLDFNGRPFASWTDDGYLVKGLYQVADGWRDADSSGKRQMKDDGLAPRVARAPILRQRTEYEWSDDGDLEDATLLDEPKDQRVLIDISRFQGGRGYEVHVLDADEFEDEFGSLDAELPRTDDGYVDRELESDGIELGMPYTAAADEILEQAGYSVHMYTGDGWQDEPDDWSPQSTSEVGEFGVSASSGDAEGFTPKQQQFVDETVGELKGSGMTPEEMFDGGLAGLIGKFSGQFDVVPDVEDVRESIYAEVSHLDVDDLDE